MAAPLGNTNGVKGKLFEGAIRAALNKVEEGDRAHARTRLQAIAEKMVEKAVEGDIIAMREVMDRMDGKPKQAMEHTGADGESLFAPVLANAVGLANKLKE